RRRRCARAGCWSPTRPASSRCPSCATRSRRARGSPRRRSRCSSGGGTSRTRPCAPTTAWSATPASSPTPASRPGDGGGGGVNGFDLLLLVLAVAGAIGGWRLGFVRRFASWLGAGIGVALAILVLPWVVRTAGVHSDLSILLTATAVLVLLASLGQGLGALLGVRLQQGVVDSQGARTVDA